MSGIAIVTMRTMAIPDSMVGYLSNSWGSCYLSSPIFYIYIFIHRKR